MSTSPTRYVEVDGAYVATQAFGAGPRDVVLIPSWFSNVEAIWDLPPAAAFLERLGTMCRVIMFDRRGTGLSDPPPSSDPFFEQTTDDLVAVLDAWGADRVTLLGCDGGGPLAILAAATVPERVEGLVLVNTFARLATAPDHPAGVPQAVLDGWLAQLNTQWGGHPGFEVNAPSALGDEELGRAFTRYLRMSASPGVAATTRRVLHAVDVRDVLGSVQAPTLVVHRREDAMIRLEQGRYLARHVAGARLVEVPGADHLFYVGDQDAILDEIEEFLTGVRRLDVDRVLATVLFTDIVASTELAAALGDRRWRERLDAHDRIVAQLVDRARGRLVKHTGDGVLATFDGPARAVRCSVAARDALRAAGLDVRAGLHTGEVERRGDDVAGLAVVIARRICDLAAAGEIAVSRTLTDLVIGSGLEFEPWCSVPLKGVPGQWELHRVRAA